MVFKYLPTFGGYTIKHFNLKIFTTRAELSGYLAEQKLAFQTIGLVPTMGALHAGHLSLISQALKQNDLAVCSIFVNPTQFNDPKDLEKYPRPIDTDIEKLNGVGCHILFMPAVSEMYSEDEEWHIDLNGLDSILEGKIRPGHYQGVTQIVKKLFDTVMPNEAFFGQKDYQQFLVINKMVRKYNLPLKLVMCPIVREDDGLAMSSRNIHLSEVEHQQALALFKALNLAEMLFQSKTVVEIKDEVSAFLTGQQGVILEYFQICDAEALMPASNKKDGSLVALIAARIGAVRLIDNVILQPKLKIY